MNTLSLFRKIAVAEGLSYVLLVFIAMPLKYWADMPLAVKYTGWAHGLLFMLYIVLLIMAWVEYKWSFKKSALIGVASLLPFAPFWVDKKLKEEKINNNL
jgi:integral membrane protein